MKLSKMQKKVVVNIMNGEILGYIVDLEFELRDFCITTFEVEEKKGCMEKICPWLFKTKTIKLYIDNIESIGSDVILVRLGKKSER